ncbi:MAG: hypothetical protein ACRD9S_18470 [Pyrinomonadaceae bacterium]
MRYVLGTLASPDVDRIDEALFGDDAKLEELEAVETDLIDAYVREELSAENRKQFEARLQISPALTKRVRFADALKGKIAESAIEVEPRPEPEPKWWKILFAQPVFAAAVAASLIVAAGGVPLFLAWRNLRNESNRIASERAASAQESKARQQQTTELQTKAEQLAAELQTERTQRTEDRKLIEQLQEANATGRSLSSSIASILLTPGALRSAGEAPEIIVRTGTTKVQLRLSSDANGFSSYNVTVETDEGRVVVSQNRLTTHRGLLTIAVPARRLAAGDYLVRVSGVRPSGQVESLNEYQFRVLKTH